jgi:hypothetical protein
MALAPQSMVVKMALILPGFPDHGNSPTVSWQGYLIRLALNLSRQIAHLKLGLCHSEVGLYARNAVIVRKDKILSN